jgi:hypothetical protein
LVKWSNIDLDIAMVCCACARNASALHGNSPLVWCYWLLQAALQLLEQLCKLLGRSMRSKGADMLFLPVYMRSVYHVALACVVCLVQAALQLLEQLGELYEQEHEKDLADVIRFGSQAHDAGEAVFLQALERGAAVYEAAAGSNSSSSSDRHHAAAAAAAAFQVPGPFSQRPRVGSRLVVRDNFSVALHALCAELSSWQSGPRAMSASLLRVNLVLAEAAAERHLQVCTEQYSGVCAATALAAGVQATQQHVSTDGYVCYCFCDC